MTESILLRREYKIPKKGLARLALIADSTIQAIALHGTERLSMEAIGANAGYSSSYASVYFASKDIFFEFIANYLVRKIFQEVRAKPYPKPGKESIERLIALYTSTNSNISDLVKCIHVLHNYSLKEGSNIEEIFKKYIESIKEYICNNLEVMLHNSSVEDFSELAGNVFMVLSGSCVEVIFNQNNVMQELEPRVKKLVFDKILK